MSDGEYEDYDSEVTEEEDIEETEEENEDDEEKDLDDIEEGEDDPLKKEGEDGAEDESDEEEKIEIAKEKFELKTPKYYDDLLNLKKTTLDDEQKYNNQIRDDLYSCSIYKISEEVNNITSYKMGIYSLAVWVGHRAEQIAETGLTPLSKFCDIKCLSPVDIAMLEIKLKDILGGVLISKIERKIGFKNNYEHIPIMNSSVSMQHLEINPLLEFEVTSAILKWSKENNFPEIEEKLKNINKFSPKILSNNLATEGLNSI